MLDKPTMNRLPSVCRASRVALRLAEGAFLWVSLRSRQNVSRLWCWIRTGRGSAPGVPGTSPALPQVQA